MPMWPKADVEKKQTGTTKKTPHPFLHLSICLCLTYFVVRNVLWLPKLGHIPQQKAQANSSLSSDLTLYQKCDSLWLFMVHIHYKMSDLRHKRQRKQELCGEIGIIITRGQIYINFVKSHKLIQPHEIYIQTDPMSKYAEWIRAQKSSPNSWTFNN